MFTYGQKGEEVTTGNLRRYVCVGVVCNTFSSPSDEHNKHKHQYIVATFIYCVCIVGRVDCVGAQEGFHKVDQRLLQTPFSG